MRRRVVLFALVALALVQLAVPLRMIANRQRVLESGELFRFRTGPVDPYDAFRGRYVALTMAEDTVATTEASDFVGGQRVFVLLETDDQGFARPVGIEAGRPPGGPYVEATVSRFHADPHSVRVRYPFDRYYMNEELAPAAERAYRERSGGGEGDAWVEVRIRDGSAVLEELYVAGQPIGDFLSGNG